jgi:serine phosphatase RsbU (regulator of sigma subunit)
VQGSDLITKAFNHIRAFWNRMTEGLALNQLWGQFLSDTRSTYRLYAADVDWSVFEGERHWKRRLRIIREFFWAMVMKLSPPRRILLLIALVYFIVALLAPPSSVWLIPLALLLLLLALELADRVTMKRDLQIAREIQHWLVPSEPPKLPGIDIAFATRPANTVSGDYYDAFSRPQDPNHLILAVADVAGKSVPAALLMATIQASLHTMVASSAPLGDLLAGLNRYASAHSLRGARFTTAFIAELDVTTLEMAYINAGHNPPVLRHASGELERLEAGGLPLGILADAEYECGRTLLARGDCLAIPTDGVVEAEDNAGEQYGEPRLLALCKTPPEPTAAAQLKRIMTALDFFVGTAPQHDDITCLVLMV